MKTTKFAPWGRIKRKRLRKQATWKFTKYLVFAGILCVPILYAYNWADAMFYDFTNHSYSVEYKAPVKEEIKELSDYDTIMRIMDEKGVSDEFKTDLLCLINEESGWDTERRGVNTHKDGTISLDEGLYQINSRFAPFTISRECTYNVECSTNTVVDYLIETGNWNRWFGFSNC